MNTVKSLRRTLIIASLLTVGITSIVSAALLDGLWFKLKLSVKGEAMNSTSNLVEKVSYSAPVYVNFGTNAVAHHYTAHYWTLTDTGWTNSTTTTLTAIGSNDFFYSDVSLTLPGVSGISVHTFHTVFVDAKLIGTGTVKSATYSGVGEINTGTIPDGSVTNFVFGGGTLKGSTVETNKLPFTAP